MSTEKDREERSHADLFLDTVRRMATTPKEAYIKSEQERKAQASRSTRKAKAPVHTTEG